jgi:hypothetical protein
MGEKAGPVVDFMQQNQAPRNPRALDSRGGRAVQRSIAGNDGKPRAVETAQYSGD